MNSYGSGLISVITYSSLTAGSQDISILTESGNDLLAEDSFFLEYENS